MTETTVPCPLCQATGYDMGEPCQICKGKGEIKIRAVFDIKKNLE
ncbi:hypothetical protein [Methanobacterium sp. CWC-01]|nr:hypothetical protein [Methanobacterium sp. CWC-01]